MTTSEITYKQKCQLMEDYDVWAIWYNNRGEEIGKELILPNLGELIYNELGHHFLTMIDNKEIYYYNGGYYIPNGEQ